ncbi:MAG TPA: ATP-binding protein [Solirubrobacteraceae bacterium]|jgi:signal transduction histidine kinase/CheY-like chemotaxis protein|nr:ATP-binding protein [Solirubrobacteraceae bacterium]
MVALVRRLSDRRNGAWMLAAALLIVIGAAGSAIAANAVSRSETQRSHLASQSSAAQIASTVKLGLREEEDLDLAAGAFLVDHTTLSQAKFDVWARAIQVNRRYPELVGLVWIALVPASRLSAFEQRLVPPPAIPTSYAAFTIVPSGTRPYYCLLALAVNRSAPANPQIHTDYCAEYPLVALRDSGRPLASATRLSDGVATLALATPIYRGGSVPATVSARRHAFLGWTALAIRPRVLLATALRGHPRTALVLRRNASGSRLVFTDGSAPRGAHSVTVNLNDGSTLQILGTPATSGAFAGPGALAVLVGGIALSVMLGMLVLVLGTARTRAMRLVAERTRELADEALLSATARDDAVEASNAKSVFVATVSHELRTPLSGVIGTADLLLETELDTEQHEYAEIMRSSSEGLLLVINDILDYSKIEAGKLELDPTGFALSELIAESCALVLPLARRKGIELNVQSDPGLPGWLHGDSGRLHQILINLLSNAVKFTTEGQVTIHTSATPTADGKRTTLLRVDVTDTGIGIDEPTLARLFQPFTQADNSTARKYGGSGLGLAISAQLVEMMGGTLSASSAPGKGSTFSFQVELPLADRGEPATHTPAKFSAQGERDGAGNLTDAAPLVLIAEDNPVNQMLAGRLLDRCGYRSQVVANGNEALEATAHTDYAAVLMDCQMPEMDGYEATRAIRSRESGLVHLPIIATTAHSMSGDRENCIAAGMDDYISKPIRAAELSDALKRVIAVPPPERSELATPT